MVPRGRTLLSFLILISQKRENSVDSFSHFSSKNLKHFPIQASGISGFAAFVISNKESLGFGLLKFEAIALGSVKT